MDRAQGPARKAALIVSLAANIGMLAYFKYFGFFTGIATDIILPLGISFHTFPSISYVVDVYRREQAPVRSPLDYALFIAFFPVRPARRPPARLRPGEKDGGGRPLHPRRPYLAASITEFWGGYHGALLSAERFFGPAERKGPIRVLLPFFLVCLGWVLFRAAAFADAAWRYATTLALLLLTLEMFGVTGANIPVIYFQF